MHKTSSDPEGSKRMTEVKLESTKAKGQTNHHAAVVESELDLRVVYRRPVEFAWTWLTLDAQLL